MRDDRPPQAGDPLHVLLQQWNVRRPLPFGFESRVWQRIKAAAAPSASFLTLMARWIELALARPAPAFVYVSVLVLIGLTLGDWRAHRVTTRAENAARILYVQAVDPYQAPRP